MYAGAFWAQIQLNTSKLTGRHFIIHWDKRLRSIWIKQLLISGWRARKFSTVVEIIYYPLYYIILCYCPNTERWTCDSSVNHTTVFPCHVVACQGALRQTADGEQWLVFLLLTSCSMHCVWWTPEERCLPAPIILLMLFLPLQASFYLTEHFASCFWSQNSEINHFHL